MIFSSLVNQLYFFFDEGLDDFEELDVFLADAMISKNREKI